MTFWVIAGLMLAATVAVLLWPLTRRRPPAEGTTFDLAVYRDQLTEIEADRARGLVGEEEAAAAEAEIGRRMLATRKSAMAKASVGEPKKAVHALALVVVLVLSAGSLAVYGYLGTPELPGLPLAERSPQGGGGEGGANAPMIAQLEARLADDSRNPETWVLLARLYREEGSTQKAVDAYRRAQALAPDRPEILLGLAEGLIAINNGAVVPEARGLIARTLEIDPGSPIAIYYAGLALAQDGQLDRALHIWKQLLDSLPPDAPWSAQLRRQIAALEAARGDSSDTQDEPQEGSAEDQEAFIRSMVEQLAARLETDPNDLTGWIMLARSYRVLGEHDLAASALSRASELAENLPVSAPERQEIEAERKALEEVR